MKLAIMQPYLFPYLGYFHLVHASDSFVFYDDVNYIKNGWINRNRLLLAGAARYFTVPLSGASPFASIRDTRVQTDDLRWRRKLFDTFRMAYAGAPGRAGAMELVEKVLSTPTDSIADMARNSVTSVLEYLGLSRRIVESSCIYGNAQLRGTARVVDICRREHATQYINLTGGRELYEEEDFRAAGIELGFVESRFAPYSQPAEPFVPGLSILDLLMRCPRDEVLEMVADYRVVPG
jgi:hypothetical protein